MSCLNESYKILGIICYLNYPKYLTDANIKCVEDIYDKMEEQIEDASILMYELEKYYKNIQNENDKEIFLGKINDAKQNLLNMINQLNFIKK